jgi:tetrapyrrole methylase family protein/MazG family protein
VTAELLSDLGRRGVRLSDGLQILTSAGVVHKPFDPALALVIVPDDDRSEDAGSASFEPAALPGRMAHAADAAELLRALYPPGHPVLALADSGDTRVADVSAHDLARAPHVLPPLAAEANAASPHGLPWLVARLRGPGGCPWDREQTHLSLRKFLLEETYEVYDALERGSTPDLAEELGDLLLQVVLHAHYAAEVGVFDLSDVYREAMTKIVRRHPHVFGDVRADTVGQVLQNWERIKADERAERDGSPEFDERVNDNEQTERDHGMPAAFRGLSKSLPALAYAQEMQERAASLGYDWPDVSHVLEKVEEELHELREAADENTRREEVGDVLLVVVNLARKLGIDAEAALRGGNAKFARRFAHVERLAAERNVRLEELSFEALDELWRAAKTETRSHTGSASQ